MTNEHSVSTGYAFLAHRKVFRIDDPESPARRSVRATTAKPRTEARKPIDDY